MVVLSQKILSEFCAIFLAVNTKSIFYLLCSLYHATEELLMIEDGGMITVVSISLEINYDLCKAVPYISTQFFRVPGNAISTVIFDFRAEQKRILLQRKKYTFHIS